MQLEYSSNLEPELQSLRTKLADEIDRDSKQVEFLKRRIEKNSALLTAIKGSLSVVKPTADTEKYGGKVEAIQEAINSITEETFTQEDVEAAVQKLNPAANIELKVIRTALWNMAQKKQINLIRKGSNTAPAIYAKPGALVRFPRRDQPSLIPEPEQSGLSAGSLEDSIRRKTGRIPDVANRFHVTPEQIQAMLEPASKVYMAERGWLKVRE